MTGIELIAKERQEQIEKHGHTIEKDIIENDGNQLRWAAQGLISTIEEDFSSEWEGDKAMKMLAKPEIERLIVAGALIAAEIDRLNAIK